MLKAIINLSNASDKIATLSVVKDDEDIVKVVKPVK